MIAVALGVPSSITFALTDILRTSHIIQGCNVSSNSYIYLELSIFVTADATQAISYIVFAAYIINNYCMCNKSEDCTCYKCRAPTGLTYIFEVFYFRHRRCFKAPLQFFVVTVLLVIMFGLAFSTPIFGLLRDKDYIDSSSECASSTSKLALAAGHASVRIVVFCSTFALCLAFAMVVSSSAKKWKTNISALKYDVWDKHSDVQEFVNQKFFTFYYNYIKVGNESKMERDSLKRWFVVQYIAYLLGVLVEVVHIIRNDDPTASKWDLTNTILYLIFDMLAFFIPYYMAIWLNGLHDQYYNEMSRKFFTTDIKYGANTTYKFVPGKQKEYEENSIEKKRCSDYYNAAIAKPMTKIADFDFVPVILGISIPLENPGYTFTILVSVLSIVFNFTTVE